MVGLVERLHPVRHLDCSPKYSHEKQPIAPSRKPSQKERIVFQTSNHQFSGAFAVRFREGTPVDGWNPAPEVVYPIIYRVSAPSQVVVWDFSHQQSHEKTKIRNLNMSLGKGENINPNHQFFWGFQPLVFGGSESVKTKKCGETWTCWFFWGEVWKKYECLKATGSMFGSILLN